MTVGAERRAVPQDHKKKTGKPKPFSFTGGDGVEYTLPPASAALGKLPTRAFRDAVLNGGIAEVKFGFQALEVVGAEPEALDALYDMDMIASGKIIERWLSSKSSPKDASVPES